MNLENIARALSTRTFPNINSTQQNSVQLLEQCLACIEFDAQTQNEFPSLNLLRRLLSRFTLSVPYSNVPFCLDDPMYLDFQSIFSKLIVEKQGGCCFELHGLFNWILEEFKFSCSIVPALINRNRKDVTTRPR
jgi:arylamine N-acetyltransferase